VICHLNDAGPIITSHKIYIFFDDLLFYDRNLIEFSFMCSSSVVFTMLL